MGPPFVCRAGKKTLAINMTTVVEYAWEAGEIVFFRSQYIAYGQWLASNRPHFLIEVISRIATFK